ncbi:MAG: hypothetical protein MUF75_07985 [Bacteroidia bacterium]|nr:hypothetical protein [Bacteroidia bacterium]
MNPDSLKSEIQQVLDQDLALRKEYNELKRSLSDYRNQLIMRDEDCKRLQVTIDVLNTKLLVLERDNSSYKAELASFKYLKDSIHEQLTAKQEEIELRLQEIEDLKFELSGIASSYESKINALREHAHAEHAAISSAYEKQLEELKTNAHYRESGIREEFENRISELSATWFEREQSLLASKDSSVHELRTDYEVQLETLKNEYAGQITQIKSSNEEQLNRIQSQHISEVSELERIWAERLADKQAGYETQIGLLREEKEVLINEGQSNLESKLSEVVKAYEEKLSNILIHSNAQNTKLNEELQNLESQLKSNIQLLEQNELSLQAKSNEIHSLNTVLNQLKVELVDEAGRYAVLKSDFEIFRQNASLSDSDKVAEMSAQIERLNLEITNLGLVFQDATNQLAEAEVKIETKNTEIKVLQDRLTELENVGTNVEENLEMFKSEFQISIQEELNARYLEYQKLLAENTILINDIELSTNKQEALEGEVNLLKDELAQMRLQSQAKSEDFKESLANKQTEIEALQDNLSRMISEHQDLRLENQVLSDKLQQNSTILQSENQTLLSQIAELKHRVSTLEGQLSEANAKHETFETQTQTSGMSQNQAEQDAFIDRLFKQIDLLNDQRLALLDEKEQMAGQLLKMNEVIGSISQQVDNESIDVTGLNNHRKNVILAGNSPRNEDVSGMKEQINNLVREIDKCIALLSA